MEPRESKLELDPRRTVAEILGQYPEARPALARLGLDACCGGKHPLEFACRAHQVPVETALEAIREAVAQARAGAATGRLIDSGMSVREVIRRHPATLPVFDRHGLMGCGGPQGPLEPLGWFAHVHHVNLDQLLAELEEAAARPAGAAAAPALPSAAELARENLYRRFLKTALLFTFTGGTALGAWALAVMGIRGELGGIGRGIIQVHGHYQLFGWVGLFVVGVAYHILPRLTGIPLPSYRMASWSFVALVAGTILRTAQALDPSLARSGLLLAGAGLELAGCGIFLVLVSGILSRQEGRLLPYQSFLVAGTAWLGAAALLNLLHAGYLSARPEFEVPPYLNIPYLTVFLVGFVTFWILGVSLRTLPVFMGLKTRPALAARLVVPLSLAVATLAAGEGWLLAGGGLPARILFGAGGWATAASLILFTFALGILAPASGIVEPGVDRRYEKFLRLGYAWLAISGAMLAAFSWLALRGVSMDHALVGAYRHALTVGFITTVMVGMACRIVPVFRGVPLYSSRLLDASFWLLAIGNLIRVGFQSGSALYGPAWLKVTAISGALELTGLLLFGFNLWRTLDAEPDAAPAGREVAIRRETRVGDLLAARPELLPVFVGHGFTALANPVLRRTMARTISIGTACQMHGVDPDRLLADLTEASHSSRR